MTPKHQGVCITDRTNSWTCVMIVRVLVVLILDEVVALIRGDFAVFVRGSCWIVPICYKVSFMLWTPSTCINVRCCPDRALITNT